jgi:hypothetical protein
VADPALAAELGPGVHVIEQERGVLMVVLTLAVAADGAHLASSADR